MTRFPISLPVLARRLLVVLLVLCPVVAMAQVEARTSPDTAWTGGQPHKRLPRRHIPVAPQPGPGAVRVVNAAGDTITFASADSVRGLQGVEILANDDSAAVAELGKRRDFNPDPKRALWLSALCPGLGQIYNRRYWKLPIVAGAFVGLAYGTSWNNRMLSDYTRAYRDAMDSDPNTNSYMDFYPPTVKESDLDMEWLKKALKNKKSYYRRYRDICIIGMVAVYALCMIDAYVDASLAHFDISPDLSLQLRPSIIDSGSSVAWGAPSGPPTLGLRCAVTF
ncbi:MAG: hypothetical protein IJT30_02730 [Muribaculaceae bacterium]|nr:hypothetical protein [Muribaculaceae bacterium]